MRLAMALVGIAAAVATSACAPSGGNAEAGATSSCARGAGFSLSLASDTGGQPSPLAAARWFATHNGGVASVPAHGWSVVSQAATSATLRAGDWRLHVLRGSDGTWQVDSGQHCG